MGKHAIRQATPADMPSVMQVVEAAKGIMRQSGNLHQWVDGYPSEDVIMADIEKGYGFVRLLTAWLEDNHIIAKRSDSKPRKLLVKSYEDAIKKLAA